MPPHIHFYPTEKYCPQCHAPLKVQKTRTRRKILSTHIGGINASQVFLYCKSCANSTIYNPGELSRLVPKHGNFGYDVIGYIGRAIFQRHRTESEITEGLANMNVPISCSGVGYLSGEFVVYLALAHKNKENMIKAHMQMNGGYILHLDGTNEGDSPHLISALDELSQFVLANIKVPSESAEQIIPLLQEMKSKYGNPVAIVSDMGKGILSAVNETFNGIRIFICHFHFLRDIGKDLLEKEYSLIRNLLKKHGMSTRLRYRLRQYEKNNKEEIEINFDRIIEGQCSPSGIDEGSIKTVCYTLIQWALGGKNHGNGYGFPFDQTHLEFYQRLCKVHDILGSRDLCRVEITPKAKEYIQNLQCDIKPLKGDKNGRKAGKTLQEKSIVFDKLRKAMRLTLDPSNKGLNDDGGDADIKTIEQGVKDFKTWLHNGETYMKNQDYQKMTGQIEKYWEKLFADPITLKTPHGGVAIQPQRTNNLMEQFFRGFRRTERRRSGNNSICKRLRTMIAETPIVKNLENKKYMNILLKGKNTLTQLAGIC